MNSVLDTQISLFKDYVTSTNPVTINMLTFLQSDKHADTIEQLRTVTDKKQRDKLKGMLPACTPSGTFTYRKQSALVKHSGLLQFDVDRQDNEDLLQTVDLREALADLPYVAYVGLSASGLGYWGLVPLAYSKRHKKQFEALYYEFLSHGIQLDERPKNVASLRGYSHDEDAYYNHSAEPYTKCYTKPELPKVAVTRSYTAPISDPFAVVTRTLEKQGIAFVKNNRHTYLWQFARLCNRFGVSREQCKAHVDSVYGIHENTNWLDSYQRYATEAGTYAKPQPKVSHRIPQPAKHKAQQPKKPEVCRPYHYCVLQTGVYFGKSVTNEINEHGYPASWDN